MVLDEVKVLLIAHHLTGLQWKTELFQGRTHERWNFRYKNKVRDLKFLLELLLQNTGSTKYFSVQPLPTPPCNTSLTQAQRPGKEKWEREGLDVTVEYFPWKVLWNSPWRRPSNACPLALSAAPSESALMIRQGEVFRQATAGVRHTLCKPISGPSAARGNLLMALTAGWLLHLEDASPLLDKTRMLFLHAQKQ